MERIFASGMREYQKLRERHVSDAGTLLDGSRRAMRASFQRELDAVEQNLSFLATVGSVSPYVGLFGTVWGIMHAFTGLAALAQVTLSTVAPGIAEALVATAIGLFAAIPAVVAYNRFAREIDAIEAHLAGLATVGSVSPYIGLFGTVWGIMNAFRGLANVSQATLANVAPGIAEALIATAIGLFAAIPAVVAYNRYTHDVDRLSVRYETFIEEFSNILQRQG
jgi:biopolymer transport protein ExbB/TolQ